MTESTLRVTSHVGRDLLASASSFKTEQAVVWEYVVNSLQYVDDSVSPSVQVLVSQKDRSIEIHDNGRGMSDRDLKHFFMMHGENIDRLRGRPGRGKFGTGKSAAFGIAKTLIVDTRKAGKRNQVRLTREAIDSSAGTDVPIQWAVRNEDTELRNGTSIIIERVALSRLHVPAVVDLIERHLQVYRSLSPRVAVNETVCEARQPEIAEEFEFFPDAADESTLGPIKLLLRVARTPLPDAELGISITAGPGNLVAIETGGIERKELGNFLFGEVDCPAIEAYESSLAPFDSSRSLQLNIRHPVCAVLIPFVASKLEQVRLLQMKKLNEARRSEQARRLSKEAGRIAEILNKDFFEVVSRLQDIRSAAASGAGAAARAAASQDGASDSTQFAAGSSQPGDLQPPSTSSTGGTAERKQPKEDPRLPRSGTAASDGSSAVDPVGGPGESKRPRGGFRVDFRNLGDSSYRSDFDRSSLTILINLDHPAVKNALSIGGTADPSFRRLSYELAFTEYSLALGSELADRDPDIPGDELLYEIRRALNRVAAAAAALYAP